MDSEGFLSYFSPDVIFLAVAILICLLTKYFLDPEFPCRGRANNNPLNTTGYPKCFRISELLKIATEHYIEFIEKTQESGNTYPGETDEDLKSLVAIANCKDFKTYYPVRHASNIEVLVRLYMQLLFEYPKKFQKSIHAFIFLQILAGSKDSSKSSTHDDIYQNEKLKKFIRVSKRRFTQIDTMMPPRSNEPKFLRSISEYSGVATSTSTRLGLIKRMSRLIGFKADNSLSGLENTSLVGSLGSSSKDLKDHSIFANVTIKATLEMIVEENDQIKEIAKTESQDGGRKHKSAPPTVPIASIQSQDSGRKHKSASPSVSIASTQNKDDDSQKKSSQTS